MVASVISIFEEGNYEEQIASAARMLREGRLVVLPTETVYGAGGLLLAGGAADRLRQLAPAMPPKPLVLHLSRAEEAQKYLGELNDFARRMIRKLWPGPVGLMFDVAPERQREVAESLGVRVEDLYDGAMITLRCPEHVVTMDVLAQVNGPVVMRRAGVSDESSRSPEMIARDWGEGIDLILDAGPTRYSKASTLLRVKADGYEVIRQGVYDRRIIDRLLRTTILFVCSGNTCRSPMAEAIARKLLAVKMNVSEEELEKKGVTVISAGSFAMPGARATQAAIDALRPEGLDLSRHRSRPLTVELIHQADVIYTMGRSHAQAALALVPSAADKVVTLSPDGDIEDPIGGDVSTYQSLAGQLETLIKKRLEERPVP